MATLTTRLLAQASAITPTTLIHIVVTGDTSQSPQGSSYKAELGQLTSLFGGNTDLYITGGTYSSGTLTLTNLTGGTITITGFYTDQDDVYVTGSTLTSADNDTNSQSSQLDYHGTPIGGPYFIDTENTFITGGTYDNGTALITFSKNDGTNFTVDLSSIDVNDTYVTGGTYSLGTLDLFDNSGNTITITGFTTPFTGGSSNCITDLYVSNIHSCSPLNINPLDEGNVYFGSTSGVTIDVANGRVGIGTDSPNYRLQVTGSTGYLFYDGDQIRSQYRQSELGVGGVSSGITSVSLFQNDVTGSVGMGMYLVGNDTPNTALYRGFGNSGDTALYAFSSAQDLNIINNSGTGTTDNIKFFAGGTGTISSRIPDIHIQGSGSTRGYVGIGTTNPTAKLHVSGTSYFDTTGLTTSTIPSFRLLDGVSTPTDTTNIKSFYKEFRPTTTSSNTVATDGTIIYPNINSSTSAEFYASANLTFFTDDLSDLSSNEALTGEVNLVSIYTNTGTYNGIVKSSSAVLENAIAGGTIDKYVGFWANGLSADITHNGTTNNIYGFYMDSQSGRSGNIPPTTNRYGVYIDDDGRNYFAGTVGIGTTSPSEKLDVSGKTKTINFQMTSGATNGYVLTSDASGNATWQASSGVFTGNTSASCISDLYVSNIHSCSPLNINPLDEGNVYFGSTSGVTIDLTNNRVGVGIASPTAKLHINNTTPSASFLVEDSTNPDSTPFVIDNAGRVGIGTPTPSTTLHIGGNADSVVYEGVDHVYQEYFPQGIAAGRFGYIGYGSSGSTSLNFWNEVSTGAIIFGTENTTRMFISSSGNVGIGTTNPTAKLHVSGESRHTLVIADKGMYSFNGTNTGAGTYTNQWQKVCSFGNPANLFDYATFVMRVDVGGSTDHSNTSADVYISYKQQSSNWYVYANIINYGKTPLDVSDFEILLDSATETVTVYHKIVKNYSNPVYTYLGNSPAGLVNYGTIIGTSLSGETNDSWTQKYITNGFTSNVANGYVGIGTTTPSEKLDVSGKTKTINFQMTSGATNGYVLTSDASGNASWQASSGGVTIDPYNNVGNTGTSFNWDVSGLSTNYEVTLTANTTLNLSNVRNGDYGTIILTQDGTGGRTITFGTVNGGATTHRVVNGGGGTPTLTSNGNAIDILTFTYNGLVMFWTVGNDYT